MISPKPTVEKIVAPQYHPRMYLSKLVPYDIFELSNQVMGIFNDLSIVAIKFKALDRR